MNINIDKTKLIADNAIEILCPIAIYIFVVHKQASP